MVESPYITDKLFYHTHNVHIRVLNKIIKGTLFSLFSKYDYYNKQFFETHKPTSSMKRFTIQPLKCHQVHEASTMVKRARIRESAMLCFHNQEYVRKHFSSITKQYAQLL